MITQPKFKKAQAYAIRRLEAELSPLLTYHSLRHTRDDVVVAAKRLATIENVDAEEHMLLVTAAYFHDIGFVEQRQEHEQASVHIVKKVLPGFGFSAAQNEVITGIIMATRLPQSPRNHLEQIIADADLDALGRPDFWERNQALRIEMATFGDPVSDAEWYANQIIFMRSHAYFTLAAQMTREPTKQQHLLKMQIMIANFPGNFGYGDRS